MTFRVGSIYSGIGGLDLGFEWAGFEIAWQVELNPFCRAVLAKHWPAVRRERDVFAVDWRALPPVDVLVAGFPCQDISHAGNRLGFDGDQSWLWWRVRRAARLLRPPIVVVENVRGLFVRGIETVLGSLAVSGMTRTGRLYARATPARRIDVSACSSSPIRAEWPTPCAAPDARRHGYPGTAHPGSTLLDVAMWMTPQARDYKGISQKVAKGEYTGGLPDQIAGLVDRTKIRTTGNLNVVLNPRWVAALMGFPTDWLDVAPVPLRGDAPRLRRSATPSFRRSRTSSP